MQPFVKNQQTFSRCTHNKIENWPFLSASDKPRSLTRSQGYIHQEFHDPLLLNSSISGKNAARRPLKIYFTQITEEPPQILPLPANRCSPHPCDTPTFPANREPQTTFKVIPIRNPRLTPLVFFLSRKTADYPTQRPLLPENSEPFSNSSFYNNPQHQLLIGHPKLRPALLTHATRQPSRQTANRKPLSRSSQSENPRFTPLIFILSRKNASRSVQRRFVQKTETRSPYHPQPENPQPGNLPGKPRTINPLSWSYPQGNPQPTPLKLIHIRKSHAQLQHPPK